MSTQIQDKDFGGRSTRSRLRQLGLSLENTSILINEKSSVKRNRSRNSSIINKDNRKNDDSSLMPASCDEANDSFNISKKSLPKKAIKSRNKFKKVDDPPDVEIISQTKLTVLNITKTPEKPQAVLLPINTPSAITPQQTPQTSPVVVNLSPKRSSKTPKKSPRELASPKTHSSIHIGSAKVPRKLQLPRESPIPGPSTANKDTKQTAKVAPNTSNDKHNVFKTTEVSRNSSGEKRNHRTSSIGLKHGIRRFSKSPKIVLKTPKPKLKKSKSPLKLKFPSKRYTISGNESRTPIKISKTISMPNSEPRNATSVKTKKHNSSENLADPMNANSLIQSPMLWNAMTLKQPIVVLHRLPLSDEKTPAKNTSLLRVKDMAETAVHSPIISSAKASPLEESVRRTHRSVSKSSLETPQKLFGKPTGKNVSLLKVESAAGPASTPANDEKKYSEPMMSSTPHDRVKRLGQLNTTTDSVSKPSQAKSPWGKLISPTATADQTKSLLENISEPSLCLTDIMQGKSVSEIDGSIKDKDGTYELLEPKTPNLRDKTRKRNSPDANLDSARDAKKNFKVRFTIPTVVIDSMSNVSGRRGEKGHDDKVHTPKRNNSVKKSLFSNENSSSKSSQSSRKRPSSVTNGNVILPDSTKKTRRSNSFPSENSSLFAFSNKSDSAVKNSATKKPPNFANIHKKMFSKLESIVDAKKRIQKRHTELTTAKGGTPKRSSSKSPTSAKEATNGPYNRFGFKLRKKEATERLMQKTQLHTRKEQQQKNRDVLKGVRMNRRFELQMKARNIKV